MRFRFARSDDYPEGLRLPWGTPLEQWPDALFVDVEHGLHRNPVRFAEYEGAAYPIKELLEHVAEREYTLLRALELQQLPVVEPIGLVTERPHPPGQVDRRGLLVTRYCVTRCRCAKSSHTAQPKHRRTSCWMRWPNCS